MRSKSRKITGPRPMGGRIPGSHAKVVDNAGTIRRKPVARSQGKHDIKVRIGRFRTNEN